ELVERLRRLEVEEADQVDEQERPEEREQHGGGARHAAAEAAEAVEAEREQEAERRQVRQEDRAGDLPLHLLEGRAEHGRQEKERNEPALLSHSRLQSRFASSSTRVRRERRCRCSGER